MKNQQKKSILCATLNFCNKLSWKMYWAQNKTSDQEKSSMKLHQDLFVKNNSEADIKHPLLDEIKQRLLNFTENLEIKDP